MRLSFRVSRGAPTGGGPEQPLSAVKSIRWPQRCHPHVAAARAALPPRTTRTAAPAAPRAAPVRRQQCFQPGLECAACTRQSSPVLLRVKGVRAAMGLRVLPCRRDLRSWQQGGRNSRVEGAIFSHLRGHRERRRCRTVRALGTGSTRKAPEGKRRLPLLPQSRWPHSALSEPTAATAFPRGPRQSGWHVPPD